MAFLLLLHEKMRLKRQVNKLTLKQARFGNRLDRMTKNIERMQKMYSSRQTKLQKQAQMMQSQATVWFQNMAGLGAQNQAFSPNSYMYGSAGITSFVMNQTIGALANCNGQIPTVGTDGKTTTKQIDMNETIARQMMQEYISGTLKPTYIDSKSNDQTAKNIKGYGKNANYTSDQYEAFMSALQQGQMNQSTAQMMVSLMTKQYQDNMSIWLEAQEAQLEAEQDAVLAPLEAEQTEMELEKDSIETQLTYARERLQAIEQACSEEIKNAAPKFGLG